jgi:hypothetical protein
MARTFSLLCATGDTTISWDPENDEKWLKIIQTMIDRKYRFFILRKSKKIEVTKVTQAADTRKVIIPDKTMESLFSDAVMTIGGLLMGETTGEIAKTPEQVIENDTLVTAPVAGG